MKETDVKLVNVKTNETPQALASGQVDAIGAWQPNSGAGAESRSRFDGRSSPPRRRRA